jgi:hypothetical protein
LVADETGYDISVINAVYSSYWDEVGDALRNLRHINVLIHVICEMRISKYKIEPALTKMENFFLRRPGEDHENKYPDKYQRLMQLRNLKKLKDEEYENRAIKKAERVEYDKTKGNMV